MKILTYFARRFVAGETALDAVAAAQRMNARGLRAILDFLGEHVTSLDEAKSAVDEYHRLLDRIHHAGVQASISLKASQMGITVSTEACLDHLVTIAQHAERYRITVWLDMESSALTQKTIDVFDRWRERCPNVGLCVQAYLVRTGGDLDRLMRRPLNVRLCKGAYKEPPTISYSGKRAVDGSFRMLAQKLLENVSKGVYPAFATHDPRLIEDVKTLAEQKRVAREGFEFEMLYGISNKDLESLASQGYRTQVYIPYGQNWLPYFMRRLRERKENVYFLVRNLFKV
jgi:proline dehydrogenase